MPSRSASPIAQRGSSLAFSVASTATSPPAFLTAATSFAGALTRPSSRAKKLTVVSGGMAASTGASVASTSASFQRSTPSTIRNRRPMAKVIALSASATASGRRVVALEDLEAAAARLRLGHRAQARAALADAAVIVAVDQVGGLEGGHGDESRRARGYAALRPPARRSRCRRGRCGRAAAPAPAARDGRRGGMAIDVVAPDLDRRQPRPQALQQRRAAPGRRCRGGRP